MFGHGVFLSFIVEPVADSQHQVVGVFELAQLVSHVQEQVAGDGGLQGQDLVHPLRVGTFVIDVVANAQVDREDRHDNFAPCGQPE